ncbi:malonyl-CoA-acyl carrier protein transacylase, mitochondrial-like [Apostichopus japonicus]|uniref:malonyl-CoA-acyl carrier protein transacylase, mitochondrial-like n=1 Tax=Stichopus japonicus TaxID=307972 RepID=UPI003AB15AE7
MALAICRNCHIKLKRYRLGISLVKSLSTTLGRQVPSSNSINQFKQCPPLSRMLLPWRHYSGQQGDGGDLLYRGQKKSRTKLLALMEETDKSALQLEKEILEFDGLSKASIAELTTEKPRREKINPSLTSVLLFPGQGSQYVGMCEAFLKYPNVQDMFEVASEILQYDLKQLCTTGPKEDLDQTIFCQSAVFLTSLAGVEKLREENPKAIENCVAAAGFSVGEFAALVFAGALSFEDAVFLIQVRAEAMQRASEMVKTGMLSVVGRDQARYNYICKEAATYCQNHGIEGAMCSVANYLYPDARVLAGNVEALDFIQERAKDFSLKLTRRLPVSGAFHTSFMEPAEEKFGKALEEVTLEEPLIQVYSNIDGKVYQNPKHVKRSLKKQLTLPVKWEQTMHHIYERAKGVPFPHTFEVGPGKQLGTILKRINRKAFDSYCKV